jgi:hypothetical protein
MVYAEDFVDRFPIPKCEVSNFARRVSADRAGYKKVLVNDEPAYPARIHNLFDLSINRKIHRSMITKPFYHKSFRSIQSAIRSVREPLQLHTRSSLKSSKNSRHRAPFNRNKKFIDVDHTDPVAQPIKELISPSRPSRIGKPAKTPYAEISAGQPGHLNVHMHSMEGSSYLATWHACGGRIKSRKNSRRKKNNVETIQ